MRLRRLSCQLDLSTRLTFVRIAHLRMLPLKLITFSVLLSGIGDPGHLSSFGIETLVDLPAFGQNLHVSLLSRHISVVNADAAGCFNRITLYSPIFGP